MDDQPPSRRGAIIALLAVIAIAVLGVWLSQALHEASRTEDCLLQGRRNCAPLTPGTGR
ncbi:protein of unknown function [Rhodovastum atsumiense]|uniref:hypothetical protein n=1 Tax=Rhodovastum atsumiense TaxID=504468 RepID=UPI00139F2BFF|nr:hypothetical protein [Rhodovastum atsumiense]CAH2604679.1 protein of unknown function [Rhodovastum atsumiense]